MFPNSNKPSFVISNTPSFGFGSTSANNNQPPVGQSQLFGSTAPLFGNSSQQVGTNLITSGSAPLFTNNSQWQGFGSGLFYQQNTGAHNLCDNTSSTSFGQQSKGGIGVGASTGGTALFGQQFQHFHPSGVFGSTSGFVGNTQIGTMFKFDPVVDIDTMLQNGVVQRIKTKIHCITCMKEYGGKSLEELRFEDYSSNRKGSQAQPRFGAMPLGGGQASTAPFRQTDNKSTLDQSNTFGSTFTSGAGITGQNNQHMFSTTNTSTLGTTNTSTFGITNTSGFGTPAATSNFGFGTFTQAFGASNTSKPFGAQSTQTVSGIPTSQPFGFGNTAFNMSNTQNTVNFGKPLTSLNVQQPVFLFDQQQASQPSSNSFQLPKSTLQLGQQNNIFSQPNQNTFNAFKNLNQPTCNQQIGFNVGQSQSQTNFINKPPLINPHQGFNTLNYAAPQQLQIPNTSFDGSGREFHEIVKYICSPFPHRDFLDGIVPKKASTCNTTNPRQIKKIMNKITEPIPTADNSSQLRIITRTKSYTTDYYPLKLSLFDDLSDTTIAQTNTLPRIGSGKRLIIRPRVAKSNQQFLEEYKTMVADNNKESPSLIKRLPKLNDNIQSDYEKNIKNKSPLSEIIETPCGKFRNDRKVSFQNRDLTNDIVNSDESLIRLKSDLISSATQTEADSSLTITSLTEAATEADVTEETEAKNGSITTVSRFGLEASEAEETPRSFEIIDTCGVKLERSDYFTKPPLKCLHLHKHENGSCIVEGFTIGRFGYGEVYFPDKMDISNLNLDEIVHFRFRELTIYPDDDNKPPLGEGLNRHARVTLTHVWPRDPVTKTLVTDPEELDRIGFIERLIYISEQQNATFLEYKAETGAWIFDVHHFSTYHFTDEMFPKPDNNHGQQRQCRLQQLGTEKENHTAFDGILCKSVGVTSQDRSTSTTSGFKETSHHLLIKSMFFGKESLLGKDEENSNDMGIVSSFTIQQSTAVTPSIINVQKRRITCPRRYAVLNKSLCVPYKRSLLVTRNCMDVGIFKGRSFKVGWGKGFSFTTLNVTIGNIEDDRAAESKVFLVKVENVNANSWKIEKHLNAVLEESTIVVNEHGIPSGSVNLNWNCLLMHRNISKNNKDLKRIWDLCLVFWGPDAVTPTQRCHLFSKWLEDTALLPVAHEYQINIQRSKSITIENLFKHLTGHQIYKAMQLAMDDNMPRLGALLSQISSNNSAKELICEQLLEWREADVLKFIDTELIKIYMLLGGVPLLNEYTICHNLDWIRTLGIYFWYICPPGVSIIHAMNAYQEAFKQGNARGPISPYYEGAIVNDVLYNIMLLYASKTSSLNDVINPLTFINDPLDYQLSWLLLQSFTAIQVGTIFQHVANQVHLNFAAQLESIGLWKWSIFAALYVRDDKVKVNVILGILTKHLNRERSPGNLANEDFIVNICKIPSAWIHAILWQKTYLSRQYFDGYRHLVLLNNRTVAHDVAFKHLIPELIIHDEDHILYKLLSCLEVSKDKIFEWEYRGGLILDYLNLKKIINCNETVCNALGETRAKAALTNLCVRLRKFPIVTLKHQVTAVELSKHIAVILKKLSRKFHQRDKKFDEVVALLMNVLKREEEKLCFR